MPQGKMTTEEFRASGLQLRGQRAIVDYKAELVRQIREAGLPEPEPEYKFHPDREYRADWKIGETVLAEYEGGIFSSKPTGHRSVSGVMRDIDKYNEAVALGFVIVRVTAQTVASGAALRYIQNAVRREQERARIGSKSDRQRMKDAARALKSVVRNLDDAA